MASHHFQVSAMDSQATLVNPSPVVLIFNRNSMTNTTLVVNSQPLYMITTDLSGSRTDVKDASTQRLIVSIERKEILPDLVTFPERYDGKSIKVAKWLKNSKLEDGFPVSVMETENGRCIWKTDIVRRLALFAEDDLENALAYLRPATSCSQLALVVEPGSINIGDSIIASLLVLEQKLRMQEKMASVAQGRVRKSQHFGGGMLGL